MLHGLVSSIRDFLADPDGDRWNDARLLYLINQAQIDIVKYTKCLSAIERIDTQVDYTEVTMPADFLQLDSVLLDGKKLDIVSMDSIVSSGSLYDTGVPSKVIATNVSKGKIRLHPMGVADDIVYVQKNDLVTYGLSNTFTAEGVGVLEEVEGYFSNPKAFTSARYGLIDVLFDISFNNYDIEIIYNKLPTKILDFTQALEIGYDYDMAVQHYVCYHILRADTDAQSRTLGNEELKLYQEEVKRFKKESSIDFTSDGFHSINYRRI